MKTLLRPSLVITTYNKPDYLELVLRSVLGQTHLPLEVIVADDGSREETKNLIDEFRKTAPFPVVHVWQEDKGFRLSAARNRAFAVVQSEYVIMIDGDIILHPHFVRDHARHARPGYFVSGGRMMLPEDVTKKLLEEKRTWIRKSELSFKKTLKSFHAPWITPLMFSYKSTNYKYGAGANMAFWTKDIRAINGFDEAFAAYGYEDWDIMLRFMNAGIKKRYLRHSAVACHLYHPYKRGSEESFALNRAHFEWNEAHGITACEKGILNPQDPTEAIVTR